MHFAIETSSARETKAWGRRLASMLSGGELIALIGDLGAGKTVFIKGMAHGLQLDEQDVVSPTFTIIQEHRGRLPLYHVDLYRLERTSLDELGLREYLFSAGVAAVEWFERLGEAETIPCLAIRITYQGANERRIEFDAEVEPYGSLLAGLMRRFG
ncbi:MAG TPA: tRNA (adenosine(37)-N6)-threonylcarbamoyltransferase complex ATPase subunit type 1 TsaE [Candidatus Binataceae bacterium]